MSTVYTVAHVIGQFAFRDPGRRRAAIREITERRKEEKKERNNRAKPPDFYRNAAIYDRQDKPPSSPRKTLRSLLQFTCVSRRCAVSSGACSRACCVDARVAFACQKCFGYRVTSVALLMFIVSAILRNL